jgi:5-methyltetrahydrofolate--homocysteine methyltransferase
MEILQQLAVTLQKGQDSQVRELTRQAVEDGVPVQQVLDEGLIAGMGVVGERFRTHQIFLPEVLLAARAMYAGLDVLEPLLAAAEVPRAGTAVLGTVQGDLHDIGKNLVAIMLRGAGFSVIDLGHDVPPERFVAAARESGAQIIGMSALLTTTMPVMRRVVELLAREGLKGRIRTIIGGAPVSVEFAQEIGADGYAYDGVSAVERVKALLQDVSPGPA